MTTSSRPVNPPSLFAHPFCSCYLERLHGDVVIGLYETHACAACRLVSRVCQKSQLQLLARPRHRSGRVRLDLVVIHMHAPTTVFSFVLLLPSYRPCPVLLSRALLLGLLLRAPAVMLRLRPPRPSRRSFVSRQNCWTISSPTSLPISCSAPPSPSDKSSPRTLSAPGICTGMSSYTALRK